MHDAEEMRFSFSGLLPFFRLRANSIENMSIIVWINVKQDVTEIAA